MNQSITIVETAPIKRCRYCLIGAPDVGLVGSIALSYIIQEEQMTEVGYLDSEMLPPVMVVHRDDPKPPIRLYNKGDLVIVASEIPIDPRLIPYLARSIVNWVKDKGAELLISLSGIVVQNRLELEVPAVYGIGSSPFVKDRIKKIFRYPVGNDNDFRNCGGGSCLGSQI